MPTNGSHRDGEAIRFDVEDVARRLRHRLDRLAGTAFGAAVQVEADKVFRLKHPATGLLHIEPQTGHDLTLPDRIQLYSLLLEREYGGPVYLVALLLHQRADTTTITGLIQRRYSDGQIYHEFRYHVIRVWELELEPLMTDPNDILR